MNNENESLNNYFVIVLIFGITIGLLIAVLLQMTCTGNDCVFKKCKDDLDAGCADQISCGRSFVDECPSLCYDSYSDSFLRFENTGKNINIFVENPDDEVILTNDFIVTSYWEEEGYYYADIDNIVTE